jgi:ubiquinone/menaquinone biosynthesis C-methylase UbiE
VSPEGHIIDVGGGASTLVDDLQDNCFKHITVLDISSTALNISRARLRESADKVEWIEANIMEATLPQDYYDLWHDRAVFHFLTLAEDRRKYIEQARHALKLGGYLIIGVFGPKAPPRCSGLDVIRYSPDSLQTELGDSFTLLEDREEVHRTPSGTPQQYIYCLFRSFRDKATF